MGSSSSPGKESATEQGHPLGRMARQKNPKVSPDVPKGLKMVPAPLEGEGPIEVPHIAPENELKTVIQNHILSYNTTPFEHWERGTVNILGSIGTDAKRTKALQKHILQSAKPQEQMEILVNEFNRTFKEKI